MEAASSVSRANGTAMTGFIMLCNCGPHADPGIVLHETIVEGQPMSILPQMKVKDNGLACSVSIGVLALLPFVEYRLDRKGPIAAYHWMNIMRGVLS